MLSYKSIYSMIENAWKNLSVIILYLSKEPFIIAFHIIQASPLPSRNFPFIECLKN